jgi:regulator of sigma E protease
MITGLVFFLVLSLLILIHEFGHFYVAKKSGMLVEEFGLGLPPRVFGKKIGETLYSINLLPFGGFVKIFGESPEDLKKNPKLAPRAFSEKAWYQRALVIIAGPTMNFLLAVVVISYMFTKGTYLPADKVTVVKAQSGSPAKEAGLRKDDVLVSIAGHELKKSSELIKFSKQLAGKSVAIIIKRGDRLFQTKLTPRKNPGQNQGALGVVITDLELKKYPFYQAPLIGLKESFRISWLFYQELGRVFVEFVTFQKPQVEVAGPVGIMKLTGEAVNYGFDAVIQLVGLLSLNLALINIVPFPALDGGQLSFVIYEFLSRRRISEQVKAKINAAGFAFLLLLLILITFKDIRGLF